MTGETDTMEISPRTQQLNLGLSLGPDRVIQSAASNTFGIGQNSNVELSAQAKILQQTERNQAARQNALTNDSAALDTTEPANNKEFVRVSSSVGTDQRNNLSNEQALKIYRSIEKLL
jgi:hypothetical protein